MNSAAGRLETPRPLTAGGSDLGVGVRPGVGWDYAKSLLIVEADIIRMSEEQERTGVLLCCCDSQAFDGCSANGILSTQTKS